MLREKLKRRSPRGERTDAEHWGGPIRSSDEGFVMGCVTNTGESLRCYTEDGGRPLEAGLQAQASNRPVLLRSKDVVVSDRGKVTRKGGR